MKKILKDSILIIFFLLLALFLNVNNSMAKYVINQSKNIKPNMQIEPTNDSTEFITEWTIPSDNITITLPITTTPDIIIDWGDGTTQTVKSTSPTHKYVAAGTYEIKITGNLPVWNFYEVSTSRNYISGIKQWGEVGFTTMKNAFVYSSLKGELPAPTKNTFKDVSDFTCAFASTQITTINKNLFKDCSNATNFWGTFSQCRSLESIPDGLFDNCTNVTEFSQTFIDCSKLTDIPDNLFNNCLNAKYFQSTFSGCTKLSKVSINIKKIDIYMFKNCTSLTDIIIGDNIESIGNNAFYVDSYLNTSLTTSNQIALKYNWSGDHRTIRHIIDYEKAFITEWTTTADNTSIYLPITVNPNAIIDWGDGKTTFATAQKPIHTYKTAGVYNISILGTSLTWNFNTVATSKDYITGIKQWGEVGFTTMANAFYQCTNIVGELPTPTENSFKNVTSFKNTFYGCSGITKIPENFFDNAPKATSFTSTFRLCSSLTKVYINTANIGGSMFNRCTSLKDITIGNNVESIGASAFYVPATLETYLTTNNEVAINYNWAEDHRTLCEKTVDTEPPTVELVDSYGNVVNNNSKVNSIVTVNNVTDNFSGIEELSYKYNTSSQEFNNIESIKFNIGHMFKDSGYYEIKAVDNDKNAITIYFQIISDPTAFITEWTTTADNTTITLPITTTPDITIDWGDGTTPQKFIIIKPTHTYTTKGTYDIKITGNLPVWNFYEVSTSRNYITGIKQWGEVGFTTMDKAFYNCSKITSNIPESTENSFENVSSFDSTFYCCRELTGSIPANLFNKCSDRIMFFEGTFEGCSNLTGNIPANLFTNCNIVSSFESTFKNCSRLTGSIPTNLLESNNNATIYANTFYGCSNITSASINSTSVGNNMFYGCNRLTKITIGDKVKSIGSNAFYVSSNLATTLSTSNSVALNYNWAGDNRTIVSTASAASVNSISTKSNSNNLPELSNYTLETDSSLKATKENINILESNKTINNIQNNNEVLPDVLQKDISEDVNKKDNTSEIVNDTKQNIPKISEESLEENEEKQVAAEEITEENNNKTLQEYKNEKELEVGGNANE